MANINTNQIKSLASDMISLVNSYEKEVNNIFMKLGSMPYSTKEWIGNRAQEYVRLTAAEKKIYLDFADDLKNFAFNIQKYCENVESTYKKVADYERTNQNG